MANCQVNTVTAHAALNENCTVSILNRTAQVQPDGTFVVPNVPGGGNIERARATCVENGVTRAGQSEPFIVPANGIVDVPPIDLTQWLSPPSGLAISVPATTLTATGNTVQLSVLGSYADGSSQGAAWPLPLSVANCQVNTVTAQL